jgi:hypothetical protein
MSQKSTVTGLCSPSDASGAGVPASRASAAPQLAQKGLAASAGSPHSGHRLPSAAPQSAQKRESTPASAPQRGQVALTPVR